MEMSDNCWNGVAIAPRGWLSEKRRFTLSLLAPVIIACHQGSTAPSPLAIESVSPTSGRPSTSVTINGSGFSSTGNTVNFGTGVIPNLSPNGSILIFAVPTTLVPACAYSSPPCPFAQVTIAPGTYAVSVTNSNGTSNSVTFVVTSGVFTSYLSPTVRLEGVQDPCTASGSCEAARTPRCARPDHCLE